MLRRRLMANKGLEGFVDLGLPSGTLWAKGNIDVTTQSGFAEVICMITLAGAMMF